MPKKIERIEKYKGNTARIIFGDGENAFISFETVRKFQLEDNMEIPESAFSEIIRADTLRRGRERALYLLDYRDHSYSELVKKLMKNYDKDICFEIADDLAARGLIDDSRYAAALAAKYFERQLLGVFGVKQRLREKGIPSGIIERVVLPYEDGAGERAAELIEKKYMKYFDPSDRALMQKLKGALARKGYGFSQINEAIEIVKNKEDE